MNLRLSLVLLIAKSLLGIEIIKMSTVIYNVVVRQLKKFHQKPCNHKL